jgi:hypothetical protein
MDADQQLVNALQLLAYWTSLRRTRVTHMNAFFSPAHAAKQKTHVNDFFSPAHLSKTEKMNRWIKSRPGTGF